MRQNPAQYLGGGQWIVGGVVLMEPVLAPLDPICLFALLLPPSNVFRPKQGRKKLRGSRAKRHSQYRWAKYVHLRWETAKRCPCPAHARPHEAGSPLGR